MRQILFPLMLVCAGCQSFTDRPTRLPPPAQMPATEPPMPQSLLELEKETIKQATELAAHKQESAACELLAGFVAKNPDRCEVRLAYAVLLLQMKQAELARIEFEQFLQRCQDARPERIRMLIQAHEGLASIARAANDSYGEHLHRGIALYLTTLNHNGIKVGNEVFTNVTLMEKALADLSKARELRPDEARPCWYIYRVYRAMNQPEQADEFLRQAQENALHSRLTPRERHELDLAVRSLKVETGSR